VPEWQRGLRRRSAAAWLLGSRVRIPLGAWMLCLYVVLSCVGTGLCDGLITRPEKSYRVSKYMCDHRNPERALCSSWEPTGERMNDRSKKNRLWGGWKWMELHRDCFTYKQHWKFGICSQIATYIVNYILYGCVPANERPLKTATWKTEDMGE
jgi:hypothetical protein